MHKHKVFISYHHENDQLYKEKLVRIGKEFSIFVDKSVDTAQISDSLSDQQIREKIRDRYLRDSTVTIVLAGKETKRRKHVDWELYSSMHDGSVNRRSGILVINLPSVGGCGFCIVSHKDEKEIVYPDISSWTRIDTRSEFESLYPDMPDRIIDNLLAPKATISVAPWDKVLEADKLRFLIQSAFEDRETCEYDMSRPMRRRNS